MMSPQHRLKSVIADAASGYDELHPSERASEIVTDNFMGIAGGVSKYGAYFEA